MENFRVKGKLTIYKKDADSHLPKPQGIGRLYYDKEEDNARYGLFAAEAIIHTDGETSGSGKKQGVLWEKDELVAEGRISPKGCLLFENLELGNYYVKELDTPPEGYLLDDRAYAVSICYEGEGCSCDSHRDGCL